MATKTLFLLAIVTHNTMPYLVVLFSNQNLKQDGFTKRARTRLVSRICDSRLVDGPPIYCDLKVNQRTFIASTS